MQNLSFEQIVLADLAEIKALLLKLGAVEKAVEMYTIKEACRKLNLSRTTFDRYKNDGKIVVIKVLGKNYVTSAAIETYLNGN